MKRLLWIIVVLVQLLTLCCGAALADSETVRVCYWDGEGITRVAYADILDSKLTSLPAGYYCTLDSVTLKRRVAVQGDVYLILLEGTSIVASKGIQVPQGSSLTICRGYVGVQSGAPMGTLTATGDDSGCAGIGGNFGEINGPITINGGVVTATGGYAAPGIGGGNARSGGTITINGGTVIATGTEGTTAGTAGAGIGGGDKGSGGTITINGGDVTATGSNFAAGIGGGNNGSGGTITINGGNVTATGGDNGAGIGGGNGGWGGTVTVNDGEVRATGGSAGAGIGGGDGGSGGTVTVTGGTVIAAGNGGGAGIGGGDDGNGGNVTITGGEVIATGSTYHNDIGEDAAGIGAGSPSSASGLTLDGGSFSMTDGKVVATSGSGSIAAGHRANAIGANLRCTPGSIDIGPHLCAWIYDKHKDWVFADYDGRADICREEFVTIERCWKHAYDNGRCKRCHDSVTLSVHFYGSGTESDPYRIEGWRDWDTLAELHNEGRYRYETGKWFRLTGDIIAKSMVGTSDFRFRSNFDGGGHTLTFDVENPDDDTRIAPFAYADGSIIRNLCTEGSIDGNYDRVSGLIGENSGTSLIQNCRVSMSLSGKSFVSAFCIGDGGGLTIEGCVFDGSLSTGNRSGGFVGWSEGNLKIRNCLFIPASASWSTNCYSFYYNSLSTDTSSLTNSYWKTAYGTPQGKQAFSVTGDNGVTIDFGTPAATYSVSGITAYPTGLKYGGVFYAGEGDTVTLNPAAVPWAGYAVSSYVASAGGNMEASGSGWTLTMPADNTVISAVQEWGLDTTPVVHLTADGGTDGYRDQDPDKLFDGRTDSKWCSELTGTKWWVEFHSDVPIKPTAYSMTTAGDAASYLRRNPVSWQLMGKRNTAEEWTVLASESNNDHLPAENCVEVFFPLNVDDGYQYFYLEITAVQSGNQLQIAEFKLIGTPRFSKAAFTLPAALNAIEESAFEGMTAMTSVDAGNCATIGKWAFKDCTGLNLIHLPKNCTIDATAFSGCGRVYVFAPAGGSTETFCGTQENCVFMAK